VSALDELASVVAELGTDEHRVLLVLAKRLLLGQAAYGRLDLAHDRRDWTAEARDEALDLSVYLAIALVREAGPTR